MKFKYKFSEFIPNNIEEKNIYISLTFGTVMHKCACGCGNIVNTPLTSNDWELTFNGESISLSPSIGNWSFPCQSHYWIKKNEIVWDRKWTKEMISSSQKSESILRKQFYQSKSISNNMNTLGSEKTNWVAHCKNWLRKLFH